MRLSMSKINAAIAILRNSSDITREEAVSRFVAELNMNKGQAKQYYASAMAKIHEGVETVIAAPTSTVVEESEDAVMTRIGERFDIMDAMTQAVVEGVVRSMIVVGPPGVGKSYGITKKLEEANLFNMMQGDIRYDVVKGATTALGLYAKLYEFSRDGDVLVFDDCDSILMDELSLNILKAALDTNKKRYIHWNSDSKLLAREGIPNKFEFKGACIFITNIKFDTIRSAKLRDHLGALESRSHYIDLTMNTMRDKFLRIKQIAMTGELFKEYNFQNGEQQEILDFMIENQNRLREMSMRCAVKIADLRKTMPEKWKRTAEVTLMKNAF